MTYYPIREHLENMFKKNYRSKAFHAQTRPQFVDWSKDFRRHLQELLGINDMRLVSNDPLLIEEVQCKGYVRQKLSIQTELNVRMPFYLLLPEGREPGEKRAAIIACHGHSSAGKDAVAGVCDVETVAQTIEEYHYNYGEQLAQLGYVVLVPDARGFGERRELEQQGEEPRQLLSSSCAYLNKVAISLGQSLLGMWIFDLKCLIDYALALQCVDGRVGCVGLSGGGMQALWLAAIDERVYCSVVSGYFYGYLEALLLSDQCACNYVPRLWLSADIGDVAALIAPRPLLIETGDQDSLNGSSGLANVLNQVDIVKRAMDLFSCPDNLCHYIFSGGHRWEGATPYEWISKHMPVQLEAHHE